MNLHSPWLPYQQSVVAFTKFHAPHESIAPHAHSRAQLVFADYGTMHLRTPTRFWTIGPREGVWIPPLIEHSISMGDTPLLMRTIYVSTTQLDGPASACAVHMTDFLRQLIIEFTKRDMDYRTNDPVDRLARVLLDELSHLQVLQIDLPLGSDDRLSQLTSALLAEPGDERTLEEWGRHIGASSKTLERLFLAETGMTFKRWRQRARIASSVEMLCSGVSVTTVSHRVGYSSASAYIAAFRVVFGITPRRYLDASLQRMAHSAELRSESSVNYG